MSPLLPPKGVGGQWFHLTGAFILSLYWVIPENIYTIPRAASWNSEGEGGFLGLEFRRRGGGGVTQFGIPKAWGGVSALNSVNFQRKDGESSA